MKTDLVTTRAGVEELAPQWNTLAQLDQRDGFFRTATWYQAWMQHLKPDSEPFIIVVTDSQARIVGIAPLCRFIFRDLGFQVRAVAWGGREVVSADFLDILSEPEHRAEVVRSVTDFLWNARADWSLLLLGELIQGSDIGDAVRDFSQKRGLKTRRQEERLCPYIALPATFDAYLAGLGSSTRYHIRRRTRDIFEKAQAELSRYEDPQPIIENLDTLISLHVARWRKAGSPGTLGSQQVRAFLTQVCGNPPPGSSCSLYVLRHNSVPICALLMFFFGESALYYQAGWDPASSLASQSPVVAVMARSIDDSIQKGLKYYEFLRGDETYKKHWTKTHRTTYTFLGARRFWAREYLQVCRIKDAMKERFSKGPAVAEQQTQQKDPVELVETQNSTAGRRIGV